MAAVTAVAGALTPSSDAFVQAEVLSVTLDDVVVEINELELLYHWIPTVHEREVLFARNEHIAE